MEQGSKWTDEQAKHWYEEHSRVDPPFKVPGIEMLIVMDWAFVRATQKLIDEIFDPGARKSFQVLCPTASS